MKNHKKFQSQFFVVDRSAIVLTPKEPLSDWLNQIEAENEIEFADVAESEIFLVPEMDLEELEDWLSRNYLPLFQQILSSWYEDEELWPEDLSYDAFLEWFDIQIAEFVWDSEKIEKKKPAAPAPAAKKKSKYKK